MLQGPVRLWVATRVRLLLWKGRYEDVLELCERHQRQDPEDPALYYWLGRAHFGQKNYLSAFWSLHNALHRVVQGEAELPTAPHYFLGVSAYYLGRHRQCLESLALFRERVGRIERHLVPSVSLAKACFYMGYTHLREGDLASAAEMFEEVLRGGGIEDISVVVDLATIYCSEEVGRYRDAVRILEDALARFPREAELYKGLSYAHSLLEENQRSLLYAIKGLQMAPEDRWLHQQLAYLYAQKDVQNLGEAIRELDLLLQDNPEDRWAQDFKRHLYRSRRGGQAPSYLRLVDKLD